MRESIGGAWLYGLVIGFVLLFTSFLAIAMNYTKVFKVKNEVTSMVEKQEGFTSNSQRLPGGSLTLIANYLKAAGYSNTGRCPTGGGDRNKWYGFTEDTHRLIQANGGKYLFCVKKNKVSKVLTSSKDPDKTFTKETYFYDLVFFFKVDLPIIGELITFKIEDQTFNIYEPKEDTNMVIDTD